MSSFILRLIAITTMLIDHIGAVLMQNSEYYQLFRLIGRLSFPLFCFLVVEGVVHTKNIRNYVVRMFLFALISEIPYDLVFYGRIFYPEAQNVFWTLLLGIILAGLCFHVQAVRTNMVFRLILAGVFAYAAYIVKGDYDAMGVLLIFCLAESRVAGTAIQGLVSAFYALTVYGVQLNTFAGVSGIFMALYNGQPGSRKLKYFFYCFYPVHLFILFLIAKYY